MTGVQRLTGNVAVSVNIPVRQQNTAEPCTSLPRIIQGYLISETTKEEREKIVAESLGNIDAACDGCMSGLVEMYQDYIDGKKELREINMEFNARYVKSEDMPGREGRGYQGR